MASRGCIQHGLDTAQAGRERCWFHVPASVVGRPGPRPKIIPAIRYQHSYQWNITSTTRPWAGSIPCYINQLSEFTVCLCALGETESCFHESALPFCPCNHHSKSVPPSPVCSYNNVRSVNTRSLWGCPKPPHAPRLNPGSIWWVQVRPITSPSTATDCSS